LEPKVIVIVGPTCSGKTGLSLQIGQSVNTEIISADSRQIYRYLDIGTAKPSPEELQLAAHHFISILNPDQSYNAIRFEADALKVIPEIISRGNLPVVAGGSGLYIKSLVHGITDAADTDEDYRQELYKKRELYGNEFLYNELASVDPGSAANMLPQNWKRVVRALEVFHLTGKSINRHHQEYKRKNIFNFLQYGIEWEREALYERINMRVDGMIEAGLVEEVKKILGMGYSKSLNSLNTPGYKEIISVLDGNITLEKAVGLIKINTRHYAKRQMTWFRSDKNIKWLKITSESDLQKASRKIINSI
jgi:tRNA dimethylallyltransferase